jgi:hypothetical protein
MDSESLLIDAVGRAIRSGPSPDAIIEAVGQGEARKAHALLIWSIVEGVAGAASDHMRKGYTPDAIADGLESGGWCEFDGEVDRLAIRGVCALLRTDPVAVVCWTD